MFSFIIIFIIIIIIIIIIFYMSSFACGIHQGLDLERFIDESRGRREIYLNLCVWLLYLPIRK